MKLAAVFAVVLLAAVAGAQPDTLDTYERLFALRDSLRVWALHPPPDTVTVTEPVRFAEYFPGAELVPESDSSFAVVFPEYMDLRWGGLRGVYGPPAADDPAAGAAIRWAPGESGLSGATSARLAWLRTLPLPPPLRAPFDHAPDSVRFVLHGREIDRVTMPAGHARAVLAWMARGRQLLAAVIADQVGTDSLGGPRNEGGPGLQPRVSDQPRISQPSAGKTDSLVHSQSLASAPDSSLVYRELFALITMRGASGHHALRWREARAGRSGDVTVHMWPFIPTGNIADLFAEPDTARAGFDPIPVGPGARRDSAAGANVNPDRAAGSGEEER
ncbi:MAG: hypothetical protein MAG453_01828 [Calditrichaeota bacterium]|nr:hypothetical protein [Calditrichota bacterium]